CRTPRCALDFRGQHGRSMRRGMDEAGDGGRDSSGAAIRPPGAWALTVVIRLALDRLQPVPLLPGAAGPATTRWLGGLVFRAGLGLLIWAASAFRRARTQVTSSRRKTRIVADCRYRHSRNPL